MGTLGDVLYPDKSASTASEREWVALVHSIAAGDQRALHALYDRTHRLVFTLIMRITGNRETAEEVTLDVFHDLWRGASSYDAVNGTVLGWVMNQARSRAIDRLRFEKRKKRAGPLLGDPVPQEEHGNPSQEALEVRQHTEALHRALRSLKADERQAIETAYFSQLSYADAASRLSEPVGTVKTRIRTALQKLRRAMKDGETKP